MFLTIKLHTGNLVRLLQLQNSLQDLAPLMTLQLGKLFSDFSLAHIGITTPPSRISYTKFIKKVSYFVSGVHLLDER